MNPETPLHRHHAIGFIKHQSTDDYIINVPVATELEAEKFVQRVRVELSRMRKYVRDQGMTVKPFRMKLVGVEVIHTSDRQICTPFCKITLRKDAPDAQIARDVQDVFSELTNGARMK